LHILIAQPGLPPYKRRQSENIEQRTGLVMLKDGKIYLGTSRNPDESLQGPEYLDLITAHWT